MSKDSYDSELHAERERIAFLYSRLDDERATASGKLDGVLFDSSAETTEALWERDVAATTLSKRIGLLRVADNGLCFGRLDHADGETSYIGRIGLFDEDNDYEPLLTDWRAPIARPFYVATAANPEGITRRRHFRTRGRRVLAFHDDVLERGVADSDEVLLAALNAPRSDTMGDIVATIQAEQDEIIRLGRTGVVVIDGGPGTGKTVVALHRVAYLLYTHRERMSRRGVLIIGPNTGFLRYIGGVLPSLGETDVVFATPGELLPDVKTRAADPAREVKGGLGMVEVIRAAVEDRQELPETPIEIELDDVTVEIDELVAGKARERARGRGMLHNRAQEIFHEGLVLALAEQAVDRIGEGWLNARETPDLAGDLAADVRRELITSDQLAAAVERLWPRLSPRRLLAELYTSPGRLAAAGAPSSSVPRARRRVDRVRRAAARRGRRAARRAGVRGRGRPGPPRAGGVRARRARHPRHRGGPGRRAAACGRRDRPDAAGRAAGGARRPFAGRASRRRPRVDLRARGRRRGAGTVRNGLAGPDAALPKPFHDDRRRPRAARVAGRGAVVGRRCSTSTCRRGGCTGS